MRSEESLLLRRRQRRHAVDVMVAVALDVADAEQRHQREVLLQREAGHDDAADLQAAPYFMSAEDLTIQAGLALQQDLALVSLLGIRHVERNGHHYVNGTAALSAAEQQAFLAAHPDLYEQSRGAVRVRIRDGRLAIGSLQGVGFASGAAPEWTSMRPMPVGEAGA